MKTTPIREQIYEFIRMYVDTPEPKKLCSSIEDLVDELAESKVKNLALPDVVKSLPTKEENTYELSKRLIELNNKPEYNNKKAHNESFACGWHERDTWIRGV